MQPRIIYHYLTVPFAVKVKFLSGMEVSDNEEIILRLQRIIGGYQTPEFHLKW